MCVLSLRNLAMYNRLKCKYCRHVFNAHCTAKSFPPVFIHLMVNINSFILLSYGIDLNLGGKDQSKDY